MYLEVFQHKLQLLYHQTLLLQVLTTLELQQVPLDLQFLYGLKILGHLEVVKSNLFLTIVQLLLQLLLHKEFCLSKVVVFFLDLETVHIVIIVFHLA